MKHPLFTLLLILLLTIGTNTLAQKKISISEAVNYAGKQRMLGQRMAKNRLYIKANTNSKKAKEELKKAITAFEFGLNKLKQFAPTKKVNNQIELQEFVYIFYKSLILKNSEESLQDIIKYNTIFLKICDDGVTSIIEYSKEYKDDSIDKKKKYIIENIAKATGASGKLRYLTQRLTLYYAMDMFKIKKVNPKEINAIINIMETNLNYLTVLEFNTLEIDDSLSQVLFHWGKLKEMLYQKGKLKMNSNKITPKKLYNLCNTILSKANTTTKMYADLGNF